MSKFKKLFQYKKTMLKDSSGIIKIQIFGKTLYSLLEKRKRYKLEYLTVTAFNLCKFLKTTHMSKITNTTLDVTEPHPRWENELLLFCFLDVTDTSEISFGQILQNFQIYNWTAKLDLFKKLAKRWNALTLFLLGFWGRLRTRWPYSPPVPPPPL